MVELRVRIAPLARRELERRLRCKDEIILRRGRGRPPSEVFQRGTSRQALTPATWRIGEGTIVSWRAGAPEVLVGGGISAFGGTSTVYTYDLATGRKVALLPPGRLRIGSLTWHSSAESLMYTQSSQSVAEGDVYVRSLTEPESKPIPFSRRVWESWWSVDGSRIFAVAPRADGLGSGVANLEVFDLNSGRLVATVCRGDPRAKCP